MIAPVLSLVEAAKTCTKCGGAGPFGKQSRTSDNRLLGAAQDNIVILEAAVRYLKKGGY
jgi:hypothetical protein